MPFSHPGDPNAIELPSPAPGPGVLPIVQLPADGDPRNADSVAQGPEVSADFLAHIQSSVRLEVPAVQSTTVGVGRMFSNPIHTGAGTGTCMPASGTGWFGFRYKILITLAGAVATAKFKVSLDGGLTYGAEHTTAASYSDASGVVLAFVGTFTLNDTYAFRGTDTPLALWTTPAGKARELVDHNGFVMGQVSSHREDWQRDFTSAPTPGGTDYLPGNSLWKYTLGTDSNDPAIALQSPNADALGNFNSLLITGSTSGTTINSLQSARPLINAIATCTGVLIARRLVRLPASSAGHAVYIVLADVSFALYGGFFCVGDGSNWRAKLHNVTTPLDVDTGIAPNIGAASDWQLMQIEYYGKLSAVGIAAGNAVIRFLIDGDQVAIYTGTGFGGALFGGPMYLRHSSSGASHTPADKLELGPIAWGINWFDDPVRM